MFCASKALTTGAGGSVKLSNVAVDGDDPQQVARRLLNTEFADINLRLEPIIEADRIEFAKLRPKTVAQGLSLADRVCFAFAARLGVPALTADSIWAQAGAPVEVKLIR